MDKKKQFLLLDKELATYRKALGQAADTILEQDISKYPILVVHQVEVEIGIPIIRREQVRGNWSVNASTLEEFVARQIIDMEWVGRFKTVYKDPEEALCLFVLSELGATFIFLPRMESEGLTAGFDFPFNEN